MVSFESIGKSATLNQLVFTVNDLRAIIIENDHTK